jgi:hypothetical protein
MTQDELYAFLLAEGWKYQEIRKLTSYQIRHHIQPAAEMRARGRGI